MNVRFRFMAWRRFFVALSGAALLVTVLSLVLQGLNFGIDFRGGVVMDITTPAATTARAVQAVAPASTQPQVQELLNSGGRKFEIRMLPMSDSESQTIFAALQTRFGKATTEDSISEVSPTIGRELAQRAVLAVLVATVLMTAYLALRFQLGQGGSYAGLKFALAAVIALLHDITLTVGVFSLFRLPVNSPFVAAVLTVYGYSMNDTIIVFDRIRERLQHRGREPLPDLIDASVNQVLNRTITTVATVLLALLAVYFLGGASTRDLALALLVGVSFGTYSSVFIASPIFLWLAGEERGRTGGGRDAAKTGQRRGGGRTARAVVVTRS